MDKEKILKLLENLSEEDLQNLLNEKQKTNESSPRKRRRGKKQRSKNRNSKSTNEDGIFRPKNKNTNPNSKQALAKPIDVKSPRKNEFDNLLLEVKLDRGEQSELASAKKHDDDNKNISRTPRFRKDTRITVKCRVCGKTETVSRVLVYDLDRYKCNNCCIQAADE